MLWTRPEPLQVRLRCNPGSADHARLQGIGIDEILEAIVKRVPAPKDTRHDRLRALIFDSYYDAYKVCMSQ